MSEENTYITDRLAVLIAKNRAVSILSTLSVTGATTLSSTLGVTGIATFSTDARSPIFYDSNNTTYYVDPASTSNLNALTLAGVLYGTTQNLNSNLSITDPISGNAPRIYTSVTTGPSSTAAIRLALDQSTSGGANMFMGGSQLVGGNGTNPNIYFADSRRAYASIGGIYSGAGSIISGHIVFNTTPNDSTTALTERMRISQDGSITMGGTLGVTGAATFSSSVNADQLFVRSNTTSGASSGVLNLGTTGDPSNIANASIVGITWGLRTDSQAYYMVKSTLQTYGGYTYNRLDLSWHTGIIMGASPSYGGIRMYNNSLNVANAILFSVGDGDNHVRVGNNLYLTGTGQSSADFRAPIFYDSNDTNFYVNPASLSYVSSIQTATTALIGTTLTVGTNIIGFAGGNISGFGSITVDRLTSKSGTVALSSGVASALFTVDPHSTWIVFIAPSNTGSDDGNFTGIVTRDYGRTPVLTTLTSTGGGSGRQYSLTVSGSVVNGYANIGNTAYWQAIRIG